MNLQKTLILGFGREGKSTYYFLRRTQPELEIFVSDENQANFTNSGIIDPKLHFEAGYLQNLREYEVIYKTPGISLWSDEMIQYIHAGGVVTSQLNEFLKLYSSQIIGVTGTKGKSTTSSLIFHGLKSANQPAILVGNIGTPVFDSIEEITPDTRIVVEMSSYQLEVVTQSPHIAVMLNVFPEHLNHHRSYENYVAAKAKITQYQTPNDILIYNQDSVDLQVIASRTEAKKIPFSVQDIITEHFATLPKVVQENNLQPALIALKTLGLSEEQIFHAFRTFQPLEHRLQNIGEYQGITFIDDTLATIPEAAAQAIDSFSKVDVVILGGYDRGLDYRKIVAKVMGKRIPFVIFFKPSGEKMHQIMMENYPASDLPQIFFPEDMKEAVELVYAHATPGSTVLLSPASPSFGQFHDYEDKAKQFKKWVTELGRNQT